MFISKRHEPERRSPEEQARAERAAYQLAILSEIRMLLDYVAASPNVSLADITINNPRDMNGKLAVGDILQQIGRIEILLRSKDAPLVAEDFTILQLARDALVRKAWPASGLTIAFTALVSGQVRKHGSESRASLAGDAYVGLQPNVRIHVIMRNIFLLLAILVTLVAGWESAKVALGRSLLLSLDGLRTQQTAFNLERNRLEASLDPKSADVSPLDSLRDGPDRVRLSAFSLCNRPLALAYYLDRALPKGAMPPEPNSIIRRDEAASKGLPLPPLEILRMYGSSAEREICERDGNLGFAFRIVHQDLRQFRDNWPGMVGSVFVVAANAIHGSVCRVFTCGKPTDADRPGEDDVEFIIAPMLMVWGNYVLPVIFGLLGSLIFVILDFYNKTRTSTLHPRDTWLGPVRLVLGMVTGACIGLFFSASGPTVAGTTANLASGLSLSASGLAFLAGFGVEGVFTMLEGLVRQAFPGTPPAQRER